jgi:pilus assembly protein Flp/PilA
VHAFSSAEVLPSLETQGRNGREEIMKDLMRTFWNDESGQDLAEYGLLLALIAVIVAVAIIAFRDRIVDAFNATEAAFDA